MIDRDRRLLLVANAAVGATGVVYAAMRYAMRPASEFAVVNHPWQPHVQHLHVLLAPLLVFAVGLIWRDHVRARWDGGGQRRRASGAFVRAAAVPMIATGYLVQVLGEPRWREATGWLHAGIGGIWLLAFLLHRFFRRRGD